MDCQIELRPSDCPLGWEAHEIDCVECVYFEQIDGMHSITGKACCSCKKENDEVEE